MGNGGVLINAKHGVEKYQVARQNEENILNGYNDSVNGSRGTVTLTEEEYEKFKQLISMKFNENPVIAEYENIGGISAENTLKLSDENFTKKINEEYFELVGDEFICKKTGMYSFIMSSGMHSNWNNWVTISLMINNTCFASDEERNETNGAYCISNINTTIFFNEGDRLTGISYNSERGTYHSTSLRVYAYN